MCLEPDWIDLCQKFAVSCRELLLVNVVNLQHNRHRLIVEQCIGYMYRPRSTLWELISASEIPLLLSFLYLGYSVKRSRGRTALVSGVEERRRTIATCGGLSQYALKTVSGGELIWLGWYVCQKVTQMYKARTEYTQKSTVKCYTQPVFEILLWTFCCIVAHHCMSSPALLPRDRLPSLKNKHIKQMEQHRNTSHRKFTAHFFVISQ